MEKKRGYRLATKLNALTIALILATVVVLSGVMVRKEYRNSYEDLEDHGNILVRMVARNSEFGIYTEDRESLGALLESLSVEVDVVSARVTDENGKSIAERTFRDLPDLHKKNGNVESGDTSRGRWRRTLEFNQPVISASSASAFAPEEFFQTGPDSDERVVIGSVGLVMDTARVRMRARNSVLQVLYFTALLLAAGIGATVLLTRRIVSPLRHLREAAEEIATGKMDQMVEVRSSDEIAELSTSFNKMVENLSRSRKLVDERTEELVEANRLKDREMEARKGLETQLLHSQKMEAVGHLAGGVAHDFNNILMVITNFATLLKMELGEKGSKGNYVTEIIASAERATQLTKNLLAFSRKQVVHPEPVNINESVKDVGRMLERLIGEHIEQKTFYAGGDLFVVADRSQIEQLLINLATNARDAMKGGGVLTIQTDRREFDEEFVRMHGFGKPGSYAVISVSDTGEGMSSEVREKIFEPFYTTKDVDKGTGLGLSIVYGIIKQHGGYVDVYSERGKGTSFAVYLPLAKNIPPVRTVEQPDMAQLKGSETILLAEDESKLRTATKKILTRYGYTVLEAVDGEDAIEKFRSHSESIQLLIFDVMMPLKNGREAYEQIRLERPDVKIIFMSGYSDNVLPAGVVVEEGFPILVKPVVPRDLMLKIREVIEGEAPDPASPAAAKAEGERQDFHGGRILVAEDNASIRLVLKKRLSLLGLQADTVAHGGEALAALEKSRYDMMLMDLGMPVMDGVETATEVRRRESENAKSRIPILAMTGSMDDEVREEAKEAGFDDILIKPFGDKKIIEVLERWLPGWEDETRTGRQEGGDAVSGESAEDGGCGALSTQQLEEIRALESEGSPGLVRKVVDVYVSRAEVLIEEVRTALRDKDLEALEAAAHELKSSSANIGGEELAALCGDLETASRKGSIEGAAILAPEVQAEHRRVVAALQEIV
jgi:signal transduction histidine kinase/CheY-like chemotaxis protein/HPt (histidine-containing phosphotransfer) domain-containing protein